MVENYSKIEKLKLKLESFKVIYSTPTGQYWGFCSKGIKKCIINKIINTQVLEIFLNSNKLISYKDSKFFKKGIKFSFVSEGIKVFIKGTIIIIRVLQEIQEAYKAPIVIKKSFTFIDLFSGMGSFHYVLKKFGGKCLLAIDNDTQCNKIYYKNFGVKSKGDILSLNTSNVPSHDILCAGFPCQPFSVAGLRKGFLDKRSKVILKIFEVLSKKSPRFVILENVKGLLRHDDGKTFLTICKALKKESYFIKFKVLNTKVITNIPQNRERLFILGFKNFSDYSNFDFDFKAKNTSELKSFLELNVHDKYYYHKDSKIYNILKKNVVKSIDSGTVYQYRRGIVRENRSNVFPTLVAQMGTGGHNVPIILDYKKGIRKLTPIECLRLQGFSNYDINGFSDSCIYRLCGNSITTDVVDLIVKELLKIKK